MAETETPTQETPQATGAKGKGAVISFSIASDKTPIPTIARAGRVSKYAPLYKAAEKLAVGKRIELNLAKYSQVQAFKKRIEKLSLEISVRKTESGQLVAYIQHPEQETPKS